MAEGLEQLAVYRIRRIMNALQDIRQLPATLLASQRIRSVFAEDDEIMGRYFGRVIMSDLIAEDQAAGTRQHRPVTLVATTAPKLKHGLRISERMLHILRRIRNGNADAADLNVFDDYLVRNMDSLRTGCLQRKELLLWNMLCDTFTYDKLGIKITAGGWGMPTDLKVTPSVLWSDPVNSTPITDLQTVIRTGTEKYGQIYNRMTIPTPAMNLVSASNEFKARVQEFTPIVIPTNQFPVQNAGLIRRLIGQLLDMEVETYDFQAFSEGIDGTESAIRYLPQNKVVLWADSTDNDAESWDWANGYVTESMLIGMESGSVGEIGQPEEGPFGYVTVPPDLNPPDVTLWSVMKGFPRKHRLAANACLTVS